MFLVSNSFYYMRSHWVLRIILGENTLRADVMLGVGAWWEYTKHSCASWVFITYYNYSFQKNHVYKYDSKLDSIKRYGNRVQVDSQIILQNNCTDILVK